MNVIFILIAVSLMVAIGFLILFIWSIRSGQYEDDYTPSVRILFEDEVVGSETEGSKTLKESESNDDASETDDKPNK